MKMDNIDPNPNNDGNMMVAYNRGTDINITMTFCQTLQSMIVISCWWWIVESRLKESKR